MDIPGVTDDWEHQVNPLLHDMTGCEEDYFNAQEVSHNFCVCSLSFEIQIISIFYCSTFNIFGFKYCFMFSILVYHPGHLENFAKF
jgi:hypothetical protein